MVNRQISPLRQLMSADRGDMLILLLAILLLTGGESDEARLTGTALLLSLLL